MDENADRRFGDREPADKPDGFPPIRTTGAFDATPGVAGTWFATVYGDDPAHAGGNVFRSTNDGASWSRLAGGLPTTGNGRARVATAPADRNRVYAVISSSRDVDFGSLLGIFTSADGGTTWAKLPSPASFCETSMPLGHGTCHQRLALVVDPIDPGSLYAAGISPNRSTDYGQTWEWNNFGHSDYSALAFDTGGRLWIGNDGGVFRRATDGTLANLNATLSIAQFEWGIAGEADAEGPPSAARRTRRSSSVSPTRRGGS